MDFWTLANAVTSGLLIGLVYGLSALGLSVIFGVIRIVNFAHGEIMVMGMFFALLMFRWLGLDPLLSVPLAALLFQPSMKSAFSFALLIFVLLLRPQGLLGKAIR